jgi:O-succinylbenzoate synthase
MGLVQSLQLFRYRIALRHPAAVRGHVVSWREGVLVRVGDEAGRTGWGEVAPYPGLSAESLSEAVAALTRVADDLAGIPVDAQEVLSGAVYLRCGRLPASALFGLESALLDRMAGAAGLGLRGILSDDPRAHIEINALLAGCTDAAREEALALAEAGFRVFKVKAGDGDPAGEAAWLRRLHRALPASCRFRVDANRAWTLEQARAFLQALGDCPLEYLEEPLSDPTGLPALATSAPVAMDESFRDGGLGMLDACPDCVAVVLKPGLCGGISGVVADARELHRREVRVVISSVFESGIGVRALAHLAAGLGTPGAACGLDPYRWIVEDVVEPVVEMDTGVLDVAAMERELPMMRMDRLTPLTTARSEPLES